MVPAQAASFYLPGLVHHFGNLLLTVQGHAMTLTKDNLADGQAVILRATQRGSESLRALRILMGARTGENGSASALLRELVDLGRVGSRERGLALELREPSGEEFWVAAEPFVTICAEALWRCVGATPTGCAGSIAVDGKPDGCGRYVVAVHVHFQAGSLPFPVAYEDIRKDVLAAAHAVEIDCVTECLEDGLKMSFGASAGSAIGG